VLVRIVDHSVHAFVGGTGNASVLSYDWSTWPMLLLYALTSWIHYCWSLYWFP